MHGPNPSSEYPFRRPAFYYLALNSLHRGASLQRSQRHAAAAAVRIRLSYGECHSYRPQSTYSPHIEYGRYGDLIMVMVKSMFYLLKGNYTLNVGIPQSMKLLQFTPGSNKRSRISGFAGGSSSFIAASAFH